MQRMWHKLTLVNGIANTRERRHGHRETVIEKRRHACQKDPSHRPYTDKLLRGYEAVWGTADGIRAALVRVNSLPAAWYWGIPYGGQVEGGRGGGVGWSCPSAGRAARSSGRAGKREEGGRL
jgi:hypothetical protein